MTKADQFKKMFSDAELCASQIISTSGEEIGAFYYLSGNMWAVIIDLAVHILKYGLLDFVVSLCFPARFIVKEIW